MINNPIKIDNIVEVNCKKSRVYPFLKKKSRTIDMINAIIRLLYLSQNPFLLLFIVFPSASRDSIKRNCKKFLYLDAMR